jgi:2-keto-4-pentenoate hydratase
MLNISAAHRVAAVAGDRFSADYGPLGVIAFRFV